MCCDSGVVDECGVCGGDGSSCGLWARMQIQVAGFDEWEEFLGEFSTQMAK